MLNEEKLHAYQREGIRWLKQRKRAILADEMGLGKTVQVLGVLEPQDRVLVVCPKSCKGVWREQVHRWLGEKAILTGDTPAQRACAYSDFRNGKARFLVVGYEQLRMDVDEVSKLSIDAVVFDEAHKIKNHRTKSFKACRLLSNRLQKARIHLLTGTPIMNRASEVWTLLHICDPKKFNSYWNWVYAHLKVEVLRYPGLPEFRKVGPPKDFAKFRAMLEPYVLRREAEGLLDLPPIVEQEVGLIMDKGQRRLYESMKKKWFVELANSRVIPATTVLARLTRLRQICVDPWLLEVTDDRGEPLDDGTSDGTPDAKPAPKDDSGIEKSCKLEWLKDVLEDGEPTVVFTSFASIIPKIVRILKNDTNCVVIEGQMDSKSRLESIEKFQFGESNCIIVSTQAGAEGVSLTNASRVVFLDLPWNPALLDQAKARVYRQGQTRKVRVFYPYCADTVELKIDRMIREKRLLFEKSVPTDDVRRLLED